MFEAMFDITVRVAQYDRGTWLESEEAAYPKGGLTRKGAALFPDGKVRRVWGGIPDTFFTIPAKAKVRGQYVAGYLYFCDEARQWEGATVLRFQPREEYYHLFPKAVIKGG